MIHEIHHRGTWFIRGEDDRRYYGELDFDPTNGVELRLMALEPDIKHRFVPIILGTASQDITLEGCALKSWETNAGIRTTIFSARRVFIGAHFNSQEEITFERV